MKKTVGYKLHELLPNQELKSITTEHVIKQIDSNKVLGERLKAFCQDVDNREITPNASAFRAFLKKGKEIPGFSKQKMKHMTVLFLRACVAKGWLPDPNPEPGFRCPPC